MEHRAVRERLVQAARARELVHYGEIAQMLGIDMDNPHLGALVGKVLGEISTDEVADGRPMLSAIVVSRDTMFHAGPIGVREGSPVHERLGAQSSGKAGRD
ncbi:MAG TPA: hypothetical protein VHR55_09230 [Candidatus Limnocylindria bacterium]|nr:hypothetical protein [Candidatus Limnocylindria bacterium]